MNELSRLQIDVFLFIKKWVNVKKTPVPRKEIILYMESTGMKSYSCISVLKFLIKKGFIRVGYSTKQNTTEYVMIRNI